MAEFVDVVTRRRMTRAFRNEPLPPEQLDRLIALAAKSPSAGKSQGWHVIALEGDATAKFWDSTLEPERRPTFSWPALLSAPVILVLLADAEAYLRRYREPDKAHTGLGEGRDAWPTPYWSIDAAMAAMTLLLAAENEDLGALFFAVFNGEERLRERLAIPPGLEIVGAIALGRPAPAQPGGPARRGASAGIPTRGVAEIIHRGGW